MIPSKTISPVNANALIAYARVEKSFFDASELAVKLYEKQKRKYTNVKYVSHPLTVASLLLEVKAPVELMVAGMLAETLSRTTLKASTLRDKFGDTVADLVLAVTPPAATQGDEAHALEQFCAQLAAASPDAQTLQLANMLDHLCAIPAKELSREFRLIDDSAKILEVLGGGNPELARRVQAAIRRARA